MKDKINSALDKLFDKPLIGVPVAIFAYYIPWMLFAKLGSTKLAEYTIHIVVGAIITAFVYWLRGDRMYCCGIRKRGIKAFVPILPIVVIFIIVMSAKMVMYKDASPALFFSCVLVAFEAGFCEEMMVRGIPLGNILWKKNNLKQMILISLYSSVIFGLLHLGNVFVTGSFLVSGTQAFVDIFAGIFFVAVYLRSGSIIPGIVAHMLWDLLLFFDPGNMVNGQFQPIKSAPSMAEMAQKLSVSADLINIIMVISTVIVILVAGCMWMTLTGILLRKSKREEVVANFTK